MVEEQRLQELVVALALELELELQLELAPTLHRQSQNPKKQLQPLELLQVPLELLPKRQAMYHQYMAANFPSMLVHDLQQHPHLVLMMMQIQQEAISLAAKDQKQEDPDAHAPEA